MDENREKRTYTVDEVKEILGICRPTVIKLMQKKEFRCEAYNVGAM